MSCLAGNLTFRQQGGFSPIRLSQGIYGCEVKFQAGCGKGLKPKLL